MTEKLNSLTGEPKLGNDHHFSRHEMAEQASLTRQEVCSAFGNFAFGSGSGYGGHYASTKPGVAGMLKKYLEDNGMKTSTASTNKERWERIVRDAVPSQYHLANPHHYKSMPEHQRDNGVFKAYFLFKERFYHNEHFQWFLAILVCSFIHYVATQLYATPLTFISRWSCSAVPSQAHCGMFWLPMNATFDLLTTDLAKFFTTAIVQRGIKSLTANIFPFKLKSP